MDRANNMDGLMDVDTDGMHGMERNKLIGMDGYHGFTMSWMERSGWIDTGGWKWMDMAYRDQRGSAHPQLHAHPPR